MDDAAYSIISKSCTVKNLSNVKSSLSLYNAKHLILVLICE